MTDDVSQEKTPSMTDETHPGEPHDMQDFGDAWVVENAFDSHEGNHVGMFVIEHKGPGRPTAAAMTSAINAKLVELEVLPEDVISVNAVLNHKTREVWYYKGSGGDGLTHLPKTAT